MILVTVSFKSREVTVKGPKGTLQRSFKHMSLDIQAVPGGKEIKVDLWFGNRETIAAIRLEDRETTITMLIVLEMM
jgi:large subunit ribosomal protein L9e